MWPIYDIPQHGLLEIFCSVRELYGADWTHCHPPPPEGWFIHCSWNCKIGFLFHRGKRDLCYTLEFLILKFWHRVRSCDRYSNVFRMGQWWPSAPFRAEGGPLYHNQWLLQAIAQTFQTYNSNDNFCSNVGCATLEHLIIDIAFARYSGSWQRQMDG